MPKQAYIALCKIDFGTKQVEDDARVELDDDVAAQLLAVGAVRLAPAKASRQPAPPPVPPAPPAPAPSEPPAPPAAGEGGQDSDQPPLV